MDIGRSISYIFEDQKWVIKLMPLLFLGILSLIPVFGLLATVIALGFMTQTARNVSQGAPRPLPEWKDLSRKFQIGGDVFLAMLFYNLPTILMAMCSTWLGSGLGSSFLGSTVYIFVLCCTTPMLILYTMITWPMLAIGLAEYIRTGKSGRFYRPLHLWDMIQFHGGIVARWALFAFLVNILIGILLLIPVLGWVLILLFAYPIHGHLLGQLGHKTAVVK